MWGNYLGAQRNWEKDASIRAVDADYRSRNLIYVSGESILESDCHGADYLTYLARARSKPIPSLTCFPQEIPANEKANRELWVDAARLYCPANTKRDFKEAYPDRGRFCVAVCNHKIPLTNAFWIILDEIEESLIPSEVNKSEHDAFHREMESIRNLLFNGKRIDAADKLSMLALGQRGKGQRKKHQWRLRFLHLEDAQVRSSVEI